ncbi:hypothetical protein ACQKWADRAFT_299343 [Trichoderma austrokoningii]
MLCYILVISNVLLTALIANTTSQGPTYKHMLSYPRAKKIDGSITSSIQRAMACIACLSLAAYTSALAMCSCICT